MSEHKSYIRNLEAANARLTLDSGSLHRRFEALRAENERLEREINQKADYNMDAFERIAELQAKLERVRGAALPFVEVRALNEITGAELQALRAALKEVGDAL